MATLGEVLTGLFATPKQGYDAFRKSPNVQDTRQMSENWPIAPQAMAENRRFLPQSQSDLDNLLTVAHVYNTRMAPLPPPTPLARQAGAEDIRAPTKEEMIKFLMGEDEAKGER